MMKALLEDSGRADAKTGSPRAIIKIAFQCGMISDEENWLEALETRNILSDFYSDEEAALAIQKIKSNYVQMFEVLEKEIKEKWLNE